MNSTAKLDKKLTVNQRLTTLGLAAFVGFGSMLAFGWYQNSHVDAALEKAVATQAAIKNVSEFRLANLELVLVAVDSIIDREERAITEVGTGERLVQATGEALDRISTDVARINEHMISIVSAAREQSTGIQEINTAIGQLDQMTQQNAAMVEETNAASHTLAQDAENLTALVGQFQLDGRRDQASRPQPLRSAAHSSTHAPTHSPAKALAGKLAEAFNSSHAAPSAKAVGAA